MRGRTAWTICSMLILLAVAASSEAAVLNVPAAYSSIQKGIDAAAQGDTVLVAPGRYKENLSISGKSFTLASHFLTQQDTTFISRTVIEANEKKPAVTFQNGADSTSILTGFTVMNMGGGGISCLRSNPRLCFLRVKGGACDQLATSVGIYIEYSNVSVNRVDVLGNPLGGIVMESSSAILNNLNIFQNGELGEPLRRYGGLFISDGSMAVMRNSRISKNKSFGIYNARGLLYLGNCLVNDNVGYGIGCISYSKTNNFICHCTIANNKNDMMSCITIENTIVAFNSFDINLYQSSISHCLFWSDGIPKTKLVNLVKVNANGDSCDANFNVIMNPAFVNSFIQNYHISDFSPAIGVGVSDSTKYDIESKWRGENPDIGVFENELDRRYKSNVIVSGKVLLENQDANEGVIVRFEGLTEGTMADSTVSHTDGLYSIELRPGVYTLSFSKNTFRDKRIQSIPIYSSMSFPEMILRVQTQYQRLMIPEDYQTIQIAIDSSAPGDTVLVAPGTYIENINFRGKKNLVVGSFFITTGDTCFVSKTIIDGNQNGHVAEFSSGEDSTCVLSGVTLTNGGGERDIGGRDYSEDAFLGAGVYCLNSSPRLEHLVIRDNLLTGGMYGVSGMGGGLYCENANPTIMHTVISHNTAGTGAGIYCDHSSPRLIDITVYDSFTGSSMMLSYSISGVMCTNNSNPIIMDMMVRKSCRVAFACENSSPSITRLTIDSAIGIGLKCISSHPIIDGLILKGIGPREGEDGCGIYCQSSKPVIRNARVGSISFVGICCESGSDAMFINTIVEKISNDSPRSIYCISSSPTFINCTLSNPVSSGPYWRSTGVYSYGSSNPVLFNTIITDHTYGIQCNGGTVSIAHSNIWNALANYAHWNYATGTISGLMAVNANGDSCLLGLPVQVNANGDSCDAFFNISLDPRFTDGYHLSQDSPCIGAGAVKDFPEFDIDGVPRHNPPDMGVYEFPRTVSVEDTAPARFALLANYPNPFNPSTIISFTLPSPTRAGLAIYSVTGQRVRTLLSGPLSAGSHSVTWDGRDDFGHPVSSGVYLSRLTAGKKTATGKMLLMK